MALTPGRWWLAAVIALGLLARLAVILPWLDAPPDDPDNYLPLAATLAEGRGLQIHDRPTAYRPPLYPIVLAPVVAIVPPGGLVAAVGFLHLAFGAATIGLTERAAARWGLSDRRRLAAALIVALDPVLVVQSRSVMTETMAALLMAGALAVTARGTAAGAFGGGLMFGLGGLCRPSTLGATALAALAGGICAPGRAAVRLERAALLTLGTALVLAPWAVRNAIQLGEPILTTTHGGYTLALANNPVYYRDILDGPPGAVWSGDAQWHWFDGINRRAAGLPEPIADRQMRREAVDFIRAHPRDFARASLDRLARFWALAPSGAVYGRTLRWATAAWTAPLWLTLAAGLVGGGCGRWPRAVAPAILLALSAAHTVYWTDLRMRAPIVPAIALVAACAGWPGNRPARVDSAGNARS